VSPVLYRDVLEQHVEEAAFVWLRRAAAALSPAHDSPALAEIDERLDAHIDGVRIASEDGLAVCEAALEDSEPGTVFTLLVRALEAADAGRIDKVLALADTSAPAARGAISALAWVPVDVARKTIDALLSTNGPDARLRLGIAASSARREDPGAALREGLSRDDLRLRARALRAAGELGRLDLLPLVRAQIGAADEGCAFWGAWSAALLGERSAHAALWTIADRDGALREPAAMMAARGPDVREGRGRVEALLAWPESARIGVKAAGALGDPSIVPSLLESLTKPDLARLAGEAFTTISGVPIERSLVGEAPEGAPSGPTDRPEDTDVAMDPDWQLPWPSAPAVRRAWSERENGFRRGVRHFWGGPISADGLASVLSRGSQRARSWAALELARLSPGRPVVEVRARSR